LKELVKVKVTNWYNLGLQLDIDDDELQAIGCNNPQDQDGCKRGMFRKWLKKSPQASYTQLIRALVDIGDVNEADILCKKHSELDKFAKVVKHHHVAMRSTAPDEGRTGPMYRHAVMF